MNALDLAIIAIVALSAIFAFARGFVREALSIVAWVGAAAATIYGFHYVYRFVLPMVTTPLLADLVAGAGLFIVSLIVLTIITGTIARAVHTSRLSSIDRTLGLFFGLARGLVLVSLAYLVLDISVPPPDRPSWVREAKSAPLLEEGADMLRRVLPKELQLDNATVINSAPHGMTRAQAAAGAIDALRNPRADAATAAATPRYNHREQQQLDRLIRNQDGR